MEQKDSAERILKQIPYEIVYSAAKRSPFRSKRMEAWWCAHRNGWQNTKSKHS